MFRKSLIAVSLAALASGAAFAAVTADESWSGVASSFWLAMNTCTFFGSGTETPPGDEVVGGGDQRGGGELSRAGDEHGRVLAGRPADVHVGDALPTGGRLEDDVDGSRTAIGNRQFTGRNLQGGLRARSHQRFSLRCSAGLQACPTRRT